MIGAILEVKVILKKMVHEIMYYFSQCTDILKLFLVLVIVVTFITGNLKDCLTKKLILLKRLIIVYGTKIKVKFNGISLKQDKLTYTLGKIVNIYIVYEISKSINISNYPTLENCLFSAVSLTKNADIDRYKYSGYGIGFYRHGSLSFPGIGLGRNVIIFGVPPSTDPRTTNQLTTGHLLINPPTNQPPTQ